MSAGDGLVRVGPADELRRGMRVVPAGGVPVVVLWHDGAFHALDNRCPHLGFPLHRGDVHDGLLDCHWHHARFDVTCGRTLDPWADDVDRYETVVRDGVVYVDPRRPPRDARAHGLERLARGLEDGLTLVMAKALVEHLEAGVDPLASVALAARFGAEERGRGWAPGLSMLAAAANVLPALEEPDRARALLLACRRIATDVDGEAPRRPLPPLGGTRRDEAGLASWLRETVEVRDADGAERVLATLAAEHGPRAALEAVLAACTDHRYADVGHALDYAVKCAELADHVGGEGDLAERLFTSLVPVLAGMQRMEETSAWRRPVDVARLVADAIPVAERAWTDGAAGAVDEDALVAVLVGDDPREALGALVEELAGGASPVALADAVVAAAVRRVLAFGPANELPDWDTVHHTLTYANAVAEGMRRAPSPALFRAVLDGAASVWLDRFLNVPPAPLPAARPVPGGEPEALRGELLATYDGRSAVDEATALAWAVPARGGAAAGLLATLGAAVLREDSGFHELQELDVAWRRLARRGDGPHARLALAACARWVAARFPTPRGRERTLEVARRLHRGEPVHEAAPEPGA